jgi:hypothetical protein
MNIHLGYAEFTVEDYSLNLYIPVAVTTFWDTQIYCV